MITLDSIKIETPRDSISRIIDKDIWVTTTKQAKEYETVTHSLNLTKDERPLGLKSIAIKENTDTAIIEVSSKILKQDYYNLISINTIEQVAERINDAQIIELDPNKFISDNSRFLTVDTCNNLHVSRPKEEYFNQILGVKSNTKYRVDNYSKKKNQGVAIVGNQTSFKERCIAYNKLLEIETQGKDLLREVSYNHLKDQFKDVIRFEQNLTTAKRIKYNFNTKTTNLLDVLCSDAKPNFNLLTKVTKKYTDLSLFNEYDDMKLSQIETEVGRRSIIESCGYDMEIVKQFIRSKITDKTAYRYDKKYLETLLRMQREKGIVEPQNNVHIQELLGLLAAA